MPRFLPVVRQPVVNQTGGAASERADPGTLAALASAPNQLSIVIDVPSENCLERSRILEHGIRSDFDQAITGKRSHAGPSNEGSHSLGDVDADIRG